ncbi:MAG: hypothetical protein FWC16_14170, partial [Defluviitaleaceae bacterium]|nr:hypothetical protein [Defluviitaleaceae bacterium]
PPGVATGVTAPAQFLTSRTLNIAAQAMDAYIVNDAARRLEAELNAQGIGLQANITIYSWEDMDDHLASLQTRIAVGQGYDVFTLTHMHPLPPLVLHGHLADIFPLINSCTHTQQEDYFMHVLEALALNGRLYTFPLAFMHNYIGVNVDLPAGFITRFATYEAITLTQIAQFYLDLQETYPEFAHLAVMHNAPVVMTLRDMLHPTINWNARTLSAITPSFTQHMQTLSAAFTDNNRHGVFWESEMFTNPRGSVLTQEMHRRFVFDNIQASLDPINAFLPQNSPLFLHYIPLAAECGALVIQTSGIDSMYGISATADGALAFAFLRHLTEARGNSWRGEMSLSTPIRRDLFDEQMERAIRNALTEPHTLPFAGQGNASMVDSLVHTVRPQLKHIANQPVFTHLTRHLLPIELLAEPFNRQMLEEITREQAVQIMQANIAHFLLQPHTIEADAELLEEMRIQAEREELPAVTLRVLAHHDFRHVIRQAEEEMNRVWLQLDKPYAFVIQLSTYEFDDWEATQARVQTMLMAGQGYDVMFLDFFMPYRTFAQSGFLHDIYQFIDACPNTQREDFFTNVLYAYEINGGLFAFPLSFGFEWVSINTALPPSFINRFAAYDRISIGQMMAIYADLRAGHEAEFGHLQIGTQGRIGHPGVAMPHVLGSFVDFDNRIAHFTDGQFAQFLEDFRATFEGGLEFDSWITTTGSNVYTTEFLRQMAGSYVFQLTHRDLLPAHVLFTPVAPIFAHSIPVSDEYGRLRIFANGGQWGHPIWGPVVFPTAGNGTLAWEFTRHLLDAFVDPRGNAATNQWGMPVWGQNTMAIPIQQDLFEAQMRAAIHRYLQHDHQPFIGVPDDVVNATNNAINRMRQFIHQPVVIPADFGMIQAQIEEDVQHFLDGIATAQATAQRIQDRVQLWLMEQ